MTSQKITKQATLILMFLMISFGTSAQADVITVPGTAMATVYQSGEIVVETGFFNKIKNVYWRQLPTPAAGGAGYHFADWNMTFPINLPPGSKVISAVVIWDGGTEHFSIQTREVDFICGGRPFCNDSFVSIENPGLTQSFVNFVRSGTITYWFPVPPPRATTSGSVDLMPLGIGAQLEAGQGLQLFGNTEIGLANGLRRVSPGLNSKTFIKVDGTSTLNISASLTVNFIPPPTPTPTPTPQPSDDSVFGFERDLQGFKASGSLIDEIIVSPLHSFYGQQSMAIRLNLSKADSKPQQVFVENPPPVMPGGKVTIYIWLPPETAMGLSGIRPFLVSACGSYRFYGTFYPVERLKQNGWSKLVISTSSDMPPISALGLEIFKSEKGGTASSTLWLDSIRY
jgi:hypothetical protein